ncbi:baseplate J/gp47 family protein [Lichenicola sp.]|uniref:baseplate J/gp47 family protein n=1 Tax=Lichenicola sp. TaxID=2804529 RepID=UPI003AFF78C8
MQLSLQNFSTLVNTMAATVQGSCASLIDLTVGSVLRAMLEASASVALWLQYLLLQVLTMTRLATSIGSDVDSWVQDFGLTRLPAAQATGQVTLSSFSPASQGATILNGVTVRTSDAGQSFAVINGPYARAIGAPSVTVQVQAVTPGLAGNIQSGAVNVLGTVVLGIDTVSNANAFSGGAPAETDAALRLRFTTFLNTRSQATMQALAYAIASVQQSLTYTIQENVTAAGVFLPGNVHVIVDDGSGTPPASLIALVAAALDAVRPVGTTITIAPPTVLVANLDVVVTVNTATVPATVQTEIDAALVAYVNALGVGQALRFSRLAGLCYDVDAGITNVLSVLLDAASADVGGQPGSVVRAGLINVTATVG